MKITQALWILKFLMINCFVIVELCSHSNRKTYSDFFDRAQCEQDKKKYNCSNHPERTMCRYCGTGSSCGKVLSRGIRPSDADLIVREHNDLRRRVAKGEEKRGVGGGQPSAADMNELSWSDDLAEVAQRWADQCTPGHDPGHSSARATPDFPTAGQNIWRQTMSSAPDKDYFVIKSWYDEVKDFPPGNVKDVGLPAGGKLVGHYTQLVWGATTHVGCGYISFDDGVGNLNFGQIFVCNYGPGGNVLGAPVYNRGPTASKCTHASDGLCSAAINKSAQVWGSLCLLTIQVFVIHILLT